MQAAANAAPGRKCRHLEWHHGGREKSIVVVSTHLQVRNPGTPGRQAEW